MSDRIQKNEQPSLFGRFFAPDDRRALAKLVIGVVTLASIVLIFAAVAGTAIRIFIVTTGLGD